MPRLLHPGTCCYCNVVLPFSEMLTHLADCRSRRNHTLTDEDPAGAEPIFQLHIEGQELPEYWWIVEIPGAKSLSFLDQWLRRVWLECCGHMSAFTIGKKRFYNVAASEMSGLTMKPKLKDVLQPGMQFHYEYDFGSTTDLNLHVIACRVGVPVKNKVEPLARNTQPHHRCRCGQPAAVIDAFSSDEKDAWLCVQCARQREDQEDGESCEGFMPVVNSPRTGVCGYTG